MVGFAPRAVFLQSRVFRIDPSSARQPPYNTSNLCCPGSYMWFDRRQHKGVSHGPPERSEWAGMALSFVLPLPGAYDASLKRLSLERQEFDSKYQRRLRSTVACRRTRGKTHKPAAHLCTASPPPTATRTTLLPTPFHDYDTISNAQYRIAVLNIEEQHPGYRAHWGQVAEHVSP